MITENTRRMLEILVETKKINARLGEIKNKQVELEKIFDEGIVDHLIILGQFSALEIQKTALFDEFYELHHEAQFICMLSENQITITE